MLLVLLLVDFLSQFLKIIIASLSNEVHIILRHNIFKFVGRMIFDMKLHLFRSQLLILQILVELP